MCVCVCVCVCTNVSKSIVRRYSQKKLAGESSDCVSH